jgi:hypothetical protein
LFSAGGGGWDKSKSIMFMKLSKLPSVVELRSSLTTAENALADIASDEQLIVTIDQENADLLEACRDEDASKLAIVRNRREITVMRLAKRRAASPGVADQLRQSHRFCCGAVIAASRDFVDSRQVAMGEEVSQSLAKLGIDVEAINPLFISANHRQVLELAPFIHTFEAQGIVIGEALVHAVTRARAILKSIEAFDAAAAK